jgi:hypothetical protein
MRDRYIISDVGVLIMIKITVSYIRTEVGYGSSVTFDMTPDIDISEYHYMIGGTHKDAHTTIRIVKSSDKTTWNNAERAY